MSFHRVLCCLFVATAIVSAAAGACAQGTDDEILAYTPVGSRVPSEYAVQGISFHGFVFYPELKLQPYSDSNVFMAESNAQSDFITNIIPRLKIDKKYGPHSFNADLEGFLSRHREFKDENLKLYSVSTNGTVHVAQGLNFLYSAAEKRGAVSRGEPGETQYTTEPIYTQKDDFSLGFSKQFNRLTLTLIGKTNRTTYTNGVSSLTGAPLVFDDGNRRAHRVDLRADWDFLGGSSEVAEHTIYASTSYQQQRFDVSSDAPGGSNPDNSETGFLAGFSTKYKGLMFGQAGLGYFKRNFETGKDVGKLDMDANLSFNLTPKMTLSFLAGRDIDQDNSFLTGVVNTQFGGAIDYELLHNWYAGAGLVYKDKDFLGDQEGRQDKIYESSVYTRYLISPRLEGRVDLTNNTRSSNAVDADYDQNVLMFTLTGRL